MIQVIKEYFDSKGGPMTFQEYKYAPDAPIKVNVLKSKIGSWGKILKMAGAEKPAPTASEVIEAVQTQPELKVELEVELEVKVQAEPAAEAPKTAKKK